MTLQYGDPVWDGPGKWDLLTALGEPEKRVHFTITSSAVGRRPIGVIIRALEATDEEKLNFRVRADLIAGPSIWLSYNTKTRQGKVISF